MAKTLLRVRMLAALALLAFLVSSWMEPSQRAAEAQALPTETPFPTETKINLATATYNPLTPTVTPFPAPPTKSGDGIGGQTGGRLIYLPFIQDSEVQATPTATPLPTLTAPPAPPAALSRYMSTDYIDSRNSSDLYNLGRQRGGCDGGPPAHPDSFLILAFGHPWDNHTSSSAASLYGVELYPSGPLTVTLDALRMNMISFIRGYYLCVQSINPSASLTVGVGINGSVANWLTAEHGRRWAQMVDYLNNFIQSGTTWEHTIWVVGAADFEPSWGNVTSARQWADGYASYVGAHPNKYYFYGSCDGCPYITRDASGNFVAGYTPVLVEGSSWTMDDVWYLSYGVRPAWPVPEIYLIDGRSARQWQNLADWAATCNVIPYTTMLCEPRRLNVNRDMYFSAAMTQHQACLDNTRPCDPIVMNWPADGWRQLWQVLNDPNTPLTNQGALRWSTDISWKQ